MPEILAHSFYVFLGIIDVCWEHVEAFLLQPSWWLFLGAVS